MDVYITEKETGTRVALAMLPEKVKHKGSAKFQSYDIINVGEVKLPRGTKLLSFSWSGTFPGESRKSASFIKAHHWKAPKEMEHHAFPGPNAGIEINCFWDMAEKAGLWVRGTYGSPMSQALENLVEVEAVSHDGEFCYHVFKLAQ